MTSGGTESIMLACKAYRDRAYSMGIRYPEMYVDYYIIVIMCMIGRAGRARLAFLLWYLAICFANSRFDLINQKIFMFIFILFCIPGCLNLVQFVNAARE